VANSLDLDPEWGAIDLLEEVEAAFGITITDAEAERCSTVGDLYAVLCSYTLGWDAQPGSCSSSMVFHGLRRSLGPEHKRDIRPATPLTTLGRPVSRLFRTLGKQTGLRLPTYELTWLGEAGGVILTGGLLAAIVALLTAHWLTSGLAILVAGTGLPLVWVDPGRLPAGIVTVGDLAQSTAPLNSDLLGKAGGRPSDRWSILVALAAEHGTLAAGQIGPETYFHRRSLEMAAAG
jgi:hypothetical protein